jgi:hypothetical protein
LFESIANFFLCENFPSYSSSCVNIFKPYQLVQLFTSTKAALSATSATGNYDPITASQEQAQFSGKFGVGLTASILHSHIIFADGGICCYESGGVCKITTRYVDEVSLEELEVECTFGVDRGSEKVVCLNRIVRCCNNSAEDNDSQPHLSSTGTEVKIIVPGGAIVGQAPGRLRSYFEKLNLTDDILDCSVS